MNITKKTDKGDWPFVCAKENYKIWQSSVFLIYGQWTPWNSGRSRIMEFITTQNGLGKSFAVIFDLFI